MKRILYYCSFFLLASSCKEKYESPIQSPTTGYLVVDGVLNSGTGPATITLTRTTKFENKNIVYERNAIITVQGTDSSVRSLPEKTPGIYTADNLNLNSALKYRLRINTSNGKRYLSDFVEVKSNPPIDSISWKYTDEGLQTYVNTHDPQGKALYYQWYYEETWQIVSSFYPTLKYQLLGPRYSVVYKDSTTFGYDPTIVNCWQFENPLTINLGSTAKLSQDLIFLPLVFIPRRSIKLGVLYSMNLKQYTWTKEGYAFMEKMKKNTESTGSVFDPQPSELKGNIRNASDETEPVIGYFNICPLREQRIFIRPSQVPGWGYDPGCYSVEIENVSDSIIKKGLGLLPIEPMQIGRFNNIVTFRAGPPDCSDCTLRGTNKKPSYWP